MVCPLCSVQTWRWFSWDSGCHNSPQESSLGCVWPRGLVPRKLPAAGLVVVLPACEPGSGVCREGWDGLAVVGWTPLSDSSPHPGNVFGGDLEMKQAVEIAVLALTACCS